MEPEYQLKIQNKNKLIVPNRFMVKKTTSDRQIESFDIDIWNTLAK